MGEVFRARDTKLGREVALKVLPAVFADDPERLGRFKREAQLLATFNHPNIATLFGFEEVDGTHFLAMELVDGVDLAQRLKNGPFPQREALRIAADIAEAMEAAPMGRRPGSVESGRSRALRAPPSTGTPTVVRSTTSRSTETGCGPK